MMTENAQNLIQEQMLAQMGIKPLWKLRNIGEISEQVSVELSTDTSLAEHTEQVVFVEPATAKKEAVSSQPTMSANNLPAPNIPLEPSSTQPHVAVTELLPVVNEKVVVKGLSWEELIQSIDHCKACRLCEKRKRTVPGVGDRNADWMLVGEGPGAEEDERGEPFVGQAGKLLDTMLASIGLKRGNNVYIANAVKCRPPGNRTPEAAEIAVCRPYLERQIELINPKLIIALGRPAVQTLLGGEPKISSSRSKVFHYESTNITELSIKIPVVVTYHPAYLLRNLVDKSKAWEDLCFVQDQMAKLSSNQ